jgi:hypothetical protein
VSPKITTLTVEVLWQDDGKSRPPEEWEWTFLLGLNPETEGCDVEFVKVEDAE